MSAGVSVVYAGEGELWLQVSPGYAVSEWWLQERAPDLYAEWWAAPSSAVRDQLALQIEQRLEDSRPPAPGGRLRISTSGRWSGPRSATT